MRSKLAYLDRAGAVLAVAFGIASIAWNDADKAPLYFLLAYVFVRMGFP